MINPNVNDAPDAGFTLLEMLIVLVILAMLGVMATPALGPPSDGIRLQAAVSDLLGAFRRARSAAIARNGDTSVVIDVDKHTLESTAGHAFRVSSDISLQLKVAEPERTTPSRGAFRFFTDGSSTGGNVTLKLQGKKAHVCVDWLTGRAQQGEQC